jgi:hypothetical protein
MIIKEKIKENQEGASKPFCLFPVTGSKTVERIKRLSKFDTTKGESWYLRYITDRAFPIAPNSIRFLPSETFLKSLSWLDTYSIPAYASAKIVDILIEGREILDTKDNKYFNRGTFAMYHLGRTERTTPETRARIVEWLTNKDFILNGFASEYQGTLMLATLYYLISNENLPFLPETLEFMATHSNINIRHAILYRPECTKTMKVSVSLMDAAHPEQVATAEDQYKQYTRRGDPDEIMPYTDFSTALTMMTITDLYINTEH